MLQILSFEEKDVLTPKYTQFNQPHLLITIGNPGSKLNFTKTHHCKQHLTVNFVDEETITVNKVCFDKDIAKKILTFVDNYVDTVNTIIVHCGDNNSRGPAVAAALSKIINHSDDFIYSKSIPNMLVYLTILDTYFSNENYSKTWSKISYLRLNELRNRLDPKVFMLAQYRMNNRK